MTNLSTDGSKTAARTDGVDAAARALHNGDLVAFATETVYGLGADARNGMAVARIFEAKGRPSFNPLIVHVANIDEAARLVQMTPDAKALARAFWPGALTLVLLARADNGISELVSAGLETLAVRVPSHPVARALLEAARCPIAAPSANRSGRVSPTRADHVRSEFRHDAPIVLDGGVCAGGLESTIVDVSGGDPVLLRPGTISRQDLEAVLGRPVADPVNSGDARPTSPGQLESHYAPSAFVKLNVTRVVRDQALLGFGADMPEVSAPAYNLSKTGNLREAAANLFEALRMLDASGVREIAVMPIPMEGIGEAINDRLRRAAAPRN